MNDNEIIEPELVEEAKPQALERKRPEIPMTLAELAALKGEALEVIEARIQVLETLRKAAIRSTHPTDWLLFRSPDGQVTAYLQDCGADRVRDLYGIEIFDITEPVKISGTDGVFHYIVRGSGRCKLTRQTVENMEGGRSSSDDFCAGKTGAQLELDVRKAARANLDGNLTRELAGLKNVPIEEIERCWSGGPKQISNCRLGRGFGSKHERAGAPTTTAGAPKGKVPVCDACQAPLDFIKAGTRDGRSWEAYWKCKKFKWDAENRVNVGGHARISAAEWEKTIASMPSADVREPGGDDQ